MLKIVGGFIFLVLFLKLFDLWSPEPRFYMKSGPFGLACEMQRPFPFERLIFCGDPMQTFQLNQLLNSPHLSRSMEVPSNQ